MKYILYIQTNITFIKYLQSPGALWQSTFCSSLLLYYIVWNFKASFGNASFMLEIFNFDVRSNDIFLFIMMKGMLVLFLEYEIQATYICMQHANEGLMSSIQLCCYQHI